MVIFSGPCGNIQFSSDLNCCRGVRVCSLPFAGFTISIFSLPFDFGVESTCGFALFIEIFGFGVIVPSDDSWGNVLTTGKWDDLAYKGTCCQA